MRRKYGDCIREDGCCANCALGNYGRDCHNRPLTKLEYARQSAGLTQKQLAEKAGIHYRLIQKIESGEAKAENTTAKTLLAIADALNIDPRGLI